MFENTRAWSTVCDCLEIANRAIRSIALQQPFYPQQGYGYPEVPPQHASRRDAQYGAPVYPQQNQYTAYPNPQYPPQFPQGYATPYIPGKTNPNYGINGATAYAQPQHGHANYDTYFHPMTYQQQAPPDPNITCSFGYGAVPIKNNNGGHYGY